MKHLWTEQVQLPAFPQLSGDAATDVLIIGGGMAGILLALELAERGVDYLLSEASAIGSGTTKGTTAVLTAQHSYLYQDMAGRFGLNKARQYLEANLQAVERFRRYSRTIDCDFEDQPSMMYSRSDRRKLEEEAAFVRGLGFPAEFTTETGLPFPVAGAVRYPNMAQFHPLKFLAQTASGLNIREHSMVRKLDGTIAYTDRGRIKARRIVVTSHFPPFNRHGLYFVKMYQKRSFVLAVANAPQLPGTYVEDTTSGIYLRNYDSLLLVGGGDRRTGTKGRDFELVRDFVRKYFPQAEEKYCWAAQDCNSLDRVPYIGLYSPATPDLYVATGFNEWGMTSSMLSSAILADLLTGKENPFAPVFSPQRSMLSPRLFGNLGTTVANFVKPRGPRCAHLGCTLNWNETEQSWDCPCHGSRFGSKGELIDNPALHDCHVD